MQVSEEMIQWVRTPGAQDEDMSLDPNTHQEVQARAHAPEMQLGADTGAWLGLTDLQPRPKFSERPDLKGIR